MPEHPDSGQRRRWPARRITAASLLRGRFTGLTVVLLLLILAGTVVGEHQWRELIVAVAFSVFSLFAIFAAGRRLRVAVIVLAIPPVISHWTLQTSSSLALRAIGFASVSAFLAFMTLVILVTVFRDETVTADTIVGAICAYLLLAISWGSWYTLLVLVTPDAFSVSPTLAAAAGWHTPQSPFPPLMEYYSFSTLTTLGYGDITPISPGARVLSVFEGITGQLYLAVLIARLVGMHSARSMR